MPKLSISQRAQIRRAKTMGSTKYAMGGNLKTGRHAPKPVTLRLAGKEIMSQLKTADRGPLCINFSGGLRIYADGRIEMDPGVTPDQAAVSFLDAVRRIAPEWFKEVAPL